MITDARYGDAAGTFILCQRDGSPASIPAGHYFLDGFEGEIAPFDAPEPGEPVPEQISDRQFAQALAEMSVLSREEALAFVKRGEVPAALQAAIDGITDADARFAVDMQVSGATTFLRSHPSTESLAEALGWSSAQMDDLWRHAAAL